MQGHVNLKHLYDDHGADVLSFLCHFTRNQADAFDLRQELFLKLTLRPDLLIGVRSERAFLLALARNLAFDRTRRREAEQRNLAQFLAEAVEISAPPAVADEPATRHFIKEAFEELPPDQRAVLILKLRDGLTFAEIAAALDISSNTAASRHRYGLKKLRDLLRLAYEQIK